MYNILIWKDHYTNMENTYVVQQNNNGTITLTPAGKVIQQGTNMSAENFNNMEYGILDNDLANRLLLLLARNNADEIEKLKAGGGGSAAGGGANFIAKTVTLEAGQWAQRNENDGIMYEMPFEGVTADPETCLVFCAVVSKEAQEAEWDRCDIRFAMQEDGYIWFKSRSGEFPTIDIDVKVLVTAESGSAIATTSARIAYVTLDANAWLGSKSPYSQVVSIPGVTKYSQVDLTPNVEQLSVFHDKDLAFVTENTNGVVTVYAIGQKPENDYTIQATITEVQL